MGGRRRGRGERQSRARTERGEGVWRESIFVFLFFHFALQFKKGGGTEVGITVDPVKIESISEFGTPKQVAKRVLDTEVLFFLFFSLGKQMIFFKFFSFPSKWPNASSTPRYSMFSHLLGGGRRRRRNSL